jgi:arylsulfatase A-like enzyme
MTPLRSAALIAALAAFDVPASAEEAPLNVVVIDICTARADRFGYTGESKGPSVTPGLDKVANNSVVFTQAWAQSSWCLPNYASLFTGHTPEVHGQYTNLPFRDLPKFETTLAEKMQKAGYRTGGFTGGIYFLPIWGLSRGFETFQNIFSTATAMPARFAETAPNLLSWIEKDSKKPFFAYATVDDLHTPYQSENPEQFDPGYEGIVHSTDVLNIRFFRAYNGEPLEANSPLKESLRRFREDARALKHLSAHYDAALSQADRSITAFLDRLKERGLWDNTVVIVTGDHGELLGEKGLLGHTEGLYEPILRVPLIMHHPRYAKLAGRRFDELVERLDIMPTILDVANASAEGLELQGRSLMPLLKGTVRGEEFRKYAFASSKRNMARQSDFLIDEKAVRDERWKLIWHGHKDRFELFDLRDDPREERDLSSKRPEIVSRLAFQLLKRSEASRPHLPGMPSGRPQDAKLPFSIPSDTH